MGAKDDGGEVRRLRRYSAFDGQTPDDIYNGTGAAVRDRLARERATARRARNGSEPRAKVCHLRVGYAERDGADWISEFEAPPRSR